MLCATSLFIGYQTYPSPIPSVRIIKVKTEHEMNKIIQDGHVCDLLIYFNRPSALHNFTYPSLFQHYTYSIKLPAQYRNRERNSDENLITLLLTVPNMSKNILFI